MAPRLYRGCRYVTVSEETRRELAGLGVATSRTAVVRNGLDAPPPVNAVRDPDPVLVVVGRVVPHKRVEHAVDVLARLATRWPKLRLEVVGHGWWLDRVAEHVNRQDVGDRVTLHGWVSEQDKHEILARSWVHLCPSVKEGWGIAIVEAAAHGVPSVAYRRAGGVAESIVDGETGLLAEDLDELTRHVDRLLAATSLREGMGTAGRDRAATFGWESSVDEFERVLADAVGRRRF